MSKFCTAKVAQVPWGQDRHAYSLAMLASSMMEDVPQLIKVELIEELSIDTAVGVDVVVIRQPNDVRWTQSLTS